MSARRPFSFMPALGLLLCLLALAGATRAADSPMEAKVKAAYLYHLARFVEWPNLPAEEMRVCVVGSADISGMMSQLADKPLRDRPLRIEAGNVSEPGRCQILYVAREDRRMADLLKRVRGRDVLTVSDQEDFARQGGIVGFYSEAGKVRLEINPANARGANLKISAKLLELARTVP